MLNTNFSNKTQLKIKKLILLGSTGTVRMTKKKKKKQLQAVFGCPAF
jgi:hypothetical protein